MGGRAGNGEGGGGGGSGNGYGAVTRRHGDAALPQQGTRRRSSKGTKSVGLEAVGGGHRRPQLERGPRAAPALDTRITVLPVDPPID